VPFKVAEITLSPTASINVEKPGVLQVKLILVIEVKMLSPWVRSRLRS
jgi:hypothetical protein